jgi:hypothetical protein
MRKAGILVFLLCRLWTVAAAQDSFHIRVHEYEPIPGEFVFEEHTNYIGVGTKSPNGVVAPTNNQLHLAQEFTAGLTRNFSMGAMLLDARRVDGAVEYAGWKLLPHLYAPANWRLPAEIGVVAEFTVQPKTYADGAGQIEIHPILQKCVGNFVFIANPSFGRTLNPSGENQGWTFNPALRSTYDVSKRLTMGVEYYSQSMSFHGAHTTVDIKVAGNIVLSLGVNAGPKAAQTHLVYTSRLQISWGQLKR